MIRIQLERLPGEICGGAELAKLHLGNSEVIECGRVQAVLQAHRPIRQHPRGNTYGGCHQKWRVFFITKSMKDLDDCGSSKEQQDGNKRITISGKNIEEYDTERIRGQQGVQQPNPMP